MIRIRRDIPLFDEQRKNDYEATIHNDDSRRNVHRMFLLSAEMEHRFQIDLSEFDTTMLQAFFSRISGTLSKTAAVAFINLKGYIRWSRVHGYKTSDAVNNIRIDELDKFKSRMVSSAKHLESILDIVFPNPESNQIYYVYRSYLWLAYIGVRQEEVMSITEDDLSFEEMKIIRKYPDESLEICVESVRDLRRVCALEFFIEPRARGHSSTPRQREPGNAILRGKVRSGSQDINYLEGTLRPSISRAFKKAQAEHVDEKLSLSLSYDRVRLSGIFHYVYEQEQFRGFRNFERYVDEDFRHGVYAVSETHTEKQIKSGMRCDYNNDYQRWKAVFFA